jgi:hypothetical protein
VAGPFFEAPTLSIQSSLDSAQSSIYDVTFRTGSYIVPPGRTSTDTWTQLILMFDTSYALDLGTGLPSGSRLGIVGQTLLPRGSLTCTLYHGSNSTHRPYLLV